MSVKRDRRQWRAHRRAGRYAATETSRAYMKIAKRIRSLGANVESPEGWEDRVLARLGLEADAGTAAMLALYEKPR